MYDNVDFKIKSIDVAGVDFLSQIPLHFDVTGEHWFNGENVVTGNLDGYKISVSRSGVNVKDGSLCKYLVGDNFQTLNRKDVKLAIEKLSDTLQLPFDRATITRIDVAQNFIVNHPTAVYFNHLGNCLQYIRLEQPNGLYFTNPKGLLLFYDKTKEQRSKGHIIPELYCDRNVLRYEMRHKARLKDTFKVERVTGAMLYEEAFYKGIIDRWQKSYENIQKINDVTINFEAMKGKKEFDLIGRLCLIQQQGGELAMIKQIVEAQKKGELTRRQADELKAAIRSTCELKMDINKRSDVIVELDKKVRDAVRFYL
ncbi:MAG: hypothetical protein PHR83_14805 [Paludibacter sp.]|nr:hypothetical protein [Paludibacter sp.]